MPDVTRTGALFTALAKRDFLAKMSGVGQRKLLSIALISHRDSSEGSLYYYRDFACHDQVPLHELFIS